MVNYPFKANTSWWYQANASWGYKVNASNEEKLLPVDDVKLVPGDDSFYKVSGPGRNSVYEVTSWDRTVQNSLENCNLFQPGRVA